MKKNRLHYIMGLRAYQDKDYLKAISHLSVVLSKERKSPQVLKVLADAFFRVEKYESAIKNYNAALELKPNFYEALCNRGFAFFKVGRYQDALKSCDESLVYNPNYANAFIHRGNILHKILQYEDALLSYESALQINPFETQALINKGHVLVELNRIELAVQSYTEAIRIEAENVLARFGRLIGKLPPVALSADHANMAILDFSRELREFTEWLGAKDFRIIEFYSLIGMQQPYYLAYRQGNHKAVINQYGNLLVNSAKPNSKFLQKSFRSPGKKKLLVISGYFYTHSVWTINSKGFIKHLDRSRFELLMFYVGDTYDEQTAWCEETADVWVDSRKFPKKDGWVELVCNLQPDCIYYPEIGMNPSAIFLAAHRLASVQIAGWGHPVTSGLSTIDYFISGELIEGPSSDLHYTEKLVRLPGTGCYTEPLQAPPDGDSCSKRNTLDIPRPIFVLPHVASKFDPTFDDILPEIAGLLSSCSFIFFEFKGKKQQTDDLIGRISRRFIDYDLDPSAFIHRSSQLELKEFLSLLEESDVYLDCPVFSGYTTAWLAVQQGVPIVTLEGEFMRQRLGSGILRFIGISDSIASSVKDYVQIAVQLGLESLNDPVSFNSRRAYIKCASQALNFQTVVVDEFCEFIRGKLDLESPPLASTRYRDASALVDSTLADSAKPGKCDLNTIGPLDFSEKKMAKYEFPWELLDSNLHIHSLKHDYAPVGLLEMISDPPTNVLDIGCFCGGTGKWLNNCFPGTRIIGIEMLREAAEVAAPFYDEVILGRFEDVPLNRFSSKFDAIIAADVLEHMYNPWKVLQNIRHLLKDGGFLYISIPNVRNLKILSGLSKGEWKYSDAGVLDITHIRFFTRKQILEMLDQTGWVMSDIKVNLDPTLVHQLEGKDLNSISQINIDNMSISNLKTEDILDYFCIQFFIKASVAPAFDL